MPLLLVQPGYISYAATISSVWIRQLCRYNYIQYFFSCQSLREEERAENEELLAYIEELRRSHPAPPSEKDMKSPTRSPQAK